MTATLESIARIRRLRRLTRLSQRPTPHAYRPPLLHVCLLQNSTMEEKLIAAGAAFAFVSLLVLSSILISRRRWRREREQTWFPTLDGLPDNAILNRQMAVGAVLGQNNMFPFNALDPRKSKSEMRAWLSGPWQVNSREQATEAIETLLNDGHSVIFDRLIAATTASTPPVTHDTEADLEDEDTFTDFASDEYAANLPIALEWIRKFDPTVTLTDIQRGTIAYDLGRAATVARVAFGAGYLNRAEAVAFIQAAAVASAQRFESWREFGISYLLGRAIWGGVNDPDFEGMAQIVSELLRNPRSPWIRYGWFPADARAPTR